jgi:GNAT superfamily N-acetyltransferase
VDIDIRPARPEDAETLQALIAAMGYQVSAGDVRTRLGSLPDTNVVYVAQSGTEGVGWVHVAISHSLITGSRAELAGLAVAPHAQGRGVGTALLGVAEEWTARRGVGLIYLRSGAERTEAHAFYRARGFTAVKTQLALNKPVTPAAGHPATS